RSRSANSEMERSQAKSSRRQVLVGRGILSRQAYRPMTRSLNEPRPPAGGAKVPAATKQERNARFRPAFRSPALKQERQHIVLLKKASVARSSTSVCNEQDSCYYCSRNNPKAMRSRRLIIMMKRARRVICISRPSPPVVGSRRPTMRHQVSKLWASFLMILISAGFALTQNPTGSIHGTARDPHNAEVPNATITVTYKATNAVRKLATSSDG